MRCILYMLLLAGLIACEFEGDQVYTPQTQQAFFLVEDSTGQNQLWELAENVIRLSSWNEPSLTDLVGRDQTLWLSMTNPNQLIRLTGPMFDQSLIFPLGEVNPTFLCLGDQYILISDTVQEKLFFFGLKGNAGDSLIRRSVSSFPGKAVYRSDKFYIPVGENQVLIYNETALTSLAEVRVAGEIFDLQLDATNITEIYSRVLDETWVYKINYHRNQLFSEQLVPYTKSRTSPFLRRDFGKEYLGRADLIGKRLIPPGDLTKVTDFEVDFLESIVYYIRLDSLSAYHINTSQISPIAPFHGKFKAAFYFAAYGPE